MCNPNSVTFLKNKSVPEEAILSLAKSAVSRNKCQLTVTQLICYVVYFECLSFNFFVSLR